MNIDDIEKVKRYGLTQFSKDGIVTAYDMVECPSGDYVKYSDISTLIAMVRQMNIDTEKQVSKAYAKGVDNGTRDSEERIKQIEAEMAGLLKAMFLIAKHGGKT